MVKCNIGMAWEETCPLNGSSWIVRDGSAQTIHHSRQSFVGILSKMESNLRSLLWAAQAMRDLRHKKILFEASSVEVRQALLNPQSFPALYPLIMQILDLLHSFEKWKIYHVSDQKNRVAKAIAVSVISDGRSQSYVAAGGPRWLHQTIQEDARNT